jgi:hypothetical protein
MAEIPPTPGRPKPRPPIDPDKPPVGTSFSDVFGPDVQIIQTEGEAIKSPHLVKYTITTVAFFLAQMVMIKYHYHPMQYTPNYSDTVGQNAAIILCAIVISPFWPLVLALGAGAVILLGLAWLVT